jgi:hypothetical protein
MSVVSTYSLRRATEMAEGRSVPSLFPRESLVQARPRAVRHYMRVLVFSLTRFNRQQHSQVHTVTLSIARLRSPTRFFTVGPVVDVQTDFVLEWAIESIDVLEPESDTVVRSIQPSASDRRRFADTIEPLGVVTYRITLRGQKKSRVVGVGPGLG